LSEPAFDELLRRLTEEGAEFVLIGGLAVNAWGVVRGTKDVDVVVAPDPANQKRVAEVAVAAGGHVQRGEALLGSAFSIAAEIASGEQVAIEICSVEDLRDMKRAAGRTRDLADLEDLDAAEG
jgi:predicted nucleotidyltransferase